MVREIILIDGDLQCINYKELSIETSSKTMVCNNKKPTGIKSYSQSRIVYKELSEIIL